MPEPETLNLCPSCGFEKDRTDKPICFYCNARSHYGVTKMLILKIMSDGKERDVVTLFNDLISLPYSRKIKIDSMKRNISEYDWLFDGGETIKINHKGRKYLNKLLSQWLNGELIFDNKISVNMQTIFDEINASKRAAAIKTRLSQAHTDEEIFRFINL